MAGLNIYCSDASTDVANVLDRFFEWGPVLQVSSVADLVAKVVDAWCNSSDDIESLIISGHGSPGYQATGAGRHHDSTGETSLQVDPDDPDNLLGAAKMYLPMLRGKFTHNAVVSLGACNVALGTTGLQLLKTMSRTINTFVQGGRATQRPLIPGWEGNVYRCYRDTCWISRFGYVSS